MANPDPAAGRAGHRTDPRWGSTGPDRPGLLGWLRGFTIDALVVWGSVWLCVPPPAAADRVIRTHEPSPDPQQLDVMPATAPLTFDEHRWLAELNS